MDSNYMHGILVCGEASESDEEELYYTSSCDSIACSEKSDNVVYKYKEKEVKNQGLKRIHKSNHRSLLSLKLYGANESLVEHAKQDFVDPIVSNSKKLKTLESRFTSLDETCSSTAFTMAKTRQNVDQIIFLLENLDASRFPPMKL